MGTSRVLTSSLENAQIFIKLLYNSYRQDRLPTTAAALTYQTLFAVVPLLTIVFTFMSAFEAFSGMEDKLQDFLFDYVVPENVSVVESYLSEFSAQARSLSVTSLVVLIVTAFLMMFTIEKSFNEIWRVQEPRHGFQRILLYSAILTWGPILGVGGLGITTYVLTLPLISDVTGGFFSFVSLIPFFMNVAVFTIMYVTIPNCVVPLRHGLIGAVVIALLFEIVKHSFGVVMASSDFEVIYGTFAAVPLFLLWIYLSWTLVLSGAELTKGIGLFISERSRDTEPRLIQMLIVLELFFNCHREGKVVTDRMLSGLSRRVDMSYWHDYKALLLSHGIIQQVEKGGLVLSRDLNEVSLWELYRQMPWRLPEGFVKNGSGWEQLLQERLVRHASQGREALDVDLESLFRGAVQ